MKRSRVTSGKGRMKEDAALSRRRKKVFMSQRKLNQPGTGQPKAPLTKLKELPPAERAKVMEILRSHTYRDAEPLVGELVGFACSMDVLCRFFSWQGAQEDMEISQGMLSQVAAFTREQLEGWPKEKIREEAASFFTLQTLAKRDVKGFASMARFYLQAERARIKEKKLELEQQKFEESQRNNFEAALDAIGKAFKKKPEAMRLYQQAREILLTKGD